MKLSATNTDTDMQNADAVHKSIVTMEKATTDSITPTLGKSELQSSSKTKRFPGNLMLRNLLNDADPATDSSEQQTENEQHNTAEMRDSPQTAAETAAGEKHTARTQHSK